MRNDWMPARRSDQLAMAKRWFEVLNTIGQGWGLPQASLVRLAELIEDAESYCFQGGSSYHINKLPQRGEAVNEPATAMTTIGIITGVVMALLAFVLILMRYKRAFSWSEKTPHTKHCSTEHFEVNSYNREPIW